MADSGGMVMVVTIVIGVLWALPSFSEGIEGRYCDYNFKEQVEIERFEVSMGGFGTPDMVNIHTKEGTDKVIRLRDVYLSVSEISNGDIIICEEVVDPHWYCSAKVKCRKA